VDRGLLQPAATALDPRHARPHHLRRSRPQHACGMICITTPQESEEPGQLHSSPRARATAASPRPGRAYGPHPHQPGLLERVNNVHALVDRRLPSIDHSLAHAATPPTPTTPLSSLRSSSTPARSRTPCLARGRIGGRSSLPVARSTRDKHRSRGVSSGHPRLLSDRC
jgi:hypothetical protein